MVCTQEDYKKVRRHVSSPKLSRLSHYSRCHLPPCARTALPRTMEGAHRAFFYSSRQKETKPISRGRSGLLEKKCIMASCHSPHRGLASEPVASSSAPRWYAADYHHPLPPTGAYVDVPGYATLSGLRRGPESCGSRSRGSGRSSNRSLTRSEINEVLRGATSKIVGDLTQDIRDKLEPLIPP